jgi:probable H4MPT-linked C1 transfer pathway protein
VGGAHVKASVVRGGRLVDVAQWPCPLWQGLERLDAALALAARRWPQLAQARHAVTMTGEMVDVFPDREEGVRRLARHLQGALGPQPVSFFAGDARWCASDEVASHWSDIASANWLATARHAALALGAGVLVDIGSTTTDLIAFADGGACTHHRSDAQRLASGELVYHGVVRTPLCAFARRIGFRGQSCNVMNEFFATAADVYRLTGELDPAHDQHPAADGAGKDPAATRQRLARMIGRDAREAGEDEWLAFARAWRGAQLEEIGGQLQRVLQAHRVPPGAPLVSAGCGDFLVGELAAACGRPVVAYGSAVARLDATAPREAARWAQVCAPSVAVATLFDEEHR